MISEKEKQNRDKLFRFMKKNPDLPIVPMADSEIVAEEGYARWTGAWGEVYIGEYYITGERICFRDDSDFGAIEEALGWEVFNTLSDDDAKAAYANLPWTKAIIVYIDVPEVQ